jgi:molybdopterin-guanine dinucleotide biosynthesis protein A
MTLPFPGEHVGPDHTNICRTVFSKSLSKEGARMANPSCSGVILAGGLNTRFKGQEKAFIPVGGKRMLDRVVEVFAPLFDERILVTNHPLHYLEWDLHIVTDLFATRSSLTGIHSALFYSTRPYAFCVGCDTPFLSRAVVEKLIQALEPGVDVVIPDTGAGFEPLCAAYSVRCLQAIEQNLKSSRLKIQDFFKKVRVKKIPEPNLRAVDPQLMSFFNVNTPEDLERAEAWVSAHAAESGPR